MSIGGLVGFAVLALVLVTAGSVIATTAFALAQRRLRDAGPAVEKAAAAWTLVAPIVIASAVVAVIASRASGDVDHCLGHSHHAHFCIAHGGAWLERPWAVAVAVAAGITIVLRMTITVARRFAARRAIAQIRAVAESSGGVRIAPSQRVFCFVAGWRRPEVFVSSRAWESLSADEREAVVAHERAHARAGDLWIAVVLDLAACVAAPLGGTWLRERWTDAAERLCDVRAAEATSGETVATALVRMCRAGTVIPLANGFTAAGEALERRVRSLLSGGSAGTPSRWPLALTGVAFAAAIAFAPELHHGLETLLG